MQSMDVTKGNVAKIAALFPQCVTERIGKDGKVELAIDFEKLQAELSNDILAEGEERYQFTWPDKRAASRLANESTNLTFRPCREESVDFDTTENLYIEGDNLEVLKLLQETYLHKIDVIYIDPPYNTGNNLIYKNDFSQDIRSFIDDNDTYDEEGNRLIKNLNTDGRFHTNWLNMLYPRLLLSRNLLSENGILICTIDQSEVNTLGVILKEIFSGKTVSLISIIHNPSGTQGDDFSYNNEFAFFVYNNKCIACENRSDENADIRSFMNGAKGNTTNYLRSSGANTFYPIIIKDGKIIGFGHVSDENYHPSSSNIPEDDGTIYVYPIDKDGVERKWLFERDTVEKIAKELHVKYNSKEKRYEIIRIKNNINYKTVWVDNKYNAKQYGTLLLKELMGMTVFSNPKSLYAVEECIKACIHDKNNSIILDFFSGSSTTAHAVMDLNRIDEGNRKFIMVQLPENLDINLSLASNVAEKDTIKNAIQLCDNLQKQHTICEIAKERIRRAGKKIKDELKAKENDGGLFEESGETKLDTGFRVLKLDSSNMEDVFYTPDKFEPTLLDGLLDNIKPDRSGEDLLFQVMLDLGIELSAKIERKEVAGKEVFSVDDDYLIACFDTDVDETVIEEMAKLLPTHLVIRDASASSDNVLDNFDQIVESYSNEKKINIHIL